MKEIGKLIELLNEFEEYNKNCEFDEVYNYYPYRVWYEGDFETDLTENCMNIVFIMSKTFGFIKWLVENDKISNDGIKPRTDLVKEITIVDYKTGDAIGWKNKYTEVEQLIMYLSIQDEPIRFLCEIIK